MLRFHIGIMCLQEDVRSCTNIFPNGYSSLAPKLHKPRRKFLLRPPPYSIRIGSFDPTRRIFKINCTMSFSILLDRFFIRVRSFESFQIGITIFHLSVLFWAIAHVVNVNLAGYFRQIFYHTPNSKLLLKIRLLVLLTLRLFLITRFGSI